MARPPISSTQKNHSISGQELRERRRAIADAAIQCYGNPAAELKIYGVTGTNGKTTTVDIVRSILGDDESSVASIGTLGVLHGRNGREIPGGLGLTTPGPEELQRVLRELVDLGVTHVVMEVSSHALDQARIYGIEFEGVAFTNLSRDHLDYHLTMEAYLDSKLELIRYVKPGGFVVSNADDRAWDSIDSKFAKASMGVKSPTEVLRHIKYSHETPGTSCDRVREETLVADNDTGETLNLRAVRMHYESDGSRFEMILTRDSGADRGTLQTSEVHLPLIGDFNVSNALCASAIATGAGASLSSIATRLHKIRQIPGRLEIINRAPTVIRDYAHTPDALSRAITVVRSTTSARVIVVFGAGGDRDPGKRPEMGRIAAQKGDVAIVTSDNPRTEDPLKIIDDILSGMESSVPVVIPDRRNAISRALSIAEPDDVVLLAGKGHETYQIIGVTRYDFDEKQIVKDIVQNR